MSLINVADVLDFNLQEIARKVRMISKADFVETETFVTTTIKASVQIVTAEDLKVTDVDFSKRYLQIHTKTTIDIGNYITYKNQDYKITAITDKIDYGYFKCIAEEIK